MNTGPRELQVKMIHVEQDRTGVILTIAYKTNQAWKTIFSKDVSTKLTVPQTDVAAQKEQLTSLKQTVNDLQRDKTPFKNKDSNWKSAKLKNVRYKLKDKLRRNRFQILQLTAYYSHEKLIVVSGDVKRNAYTNDIANDNSKCFYSNFNSPEWEIGQDLNSEKAVNYLKNEANLSQLDYWRDNK